MNNFRGPGRGLGRGLGRGSGRGGFLKDERRFGMGPEGECWCSKCNKEFKHVRGEPCFDRICPDCGSKMTRKI